MRLRNLFVSLVAICAMLPITVTPASGQIVRRLAESAKRSAENELDRQVEELVANAVRCVFNDVTCIERSRQDGQDVVLTDSEGNVLYDDDGRPYQHPNDLPAEMQGTPAPPPPPASTFEFVPGDRAVFYDDYSGDNLGDFPRNLTFLKGNWDLVEWEGRRLLRNTGPRGAAFRLDLAETLPEMFTIEFDAYLPHENQQMVVATGMPTLQGGNWTSLAGNFFRVASNQQAGLIKAPNTQGVESVNPAPAIHEGLVPFRIMADGNHVKVFVGELRVANVPNADLPRSTSLYFEITHFASQQDPILIGPIRVAAGGLDLYDALETDGRVAVRDILFDTSKADIRPESADILAEMGTMLQEHGELSLMIEGHTDNQGDFDFNMKLSADRAAAVRQYLIDNFGIASDRLRTMGLGSTQPVDTNDTPDGRQQNRRVELVKIS